MAKRKSTDPDQNLVIQDPELEAYKLRLAGKSAAEIASAGLGFTSAHQVTKAIASRLDREARSLSSDDRDALLQLELDRLDALQAALWFDAMSGDTRAVDSVHKIILTRLKVLQLDVPDASAMTRTVLVVRGNEDEYIEALKQVTSN